MNQKSPDFVIKVMLQLVNKKILVLLITFMGATTISAQTQKDDSRVLHVSGRSEVTLPTVFTEIRLGIDVRSKSAASAHQEAAKQSERLVQYLKSKKVDSLQTTGISLQPVYDVSKSQETVLKEYRATNMVSFQVKTEQAGSIIDGAVDNGASRIDGLSFLPKPEDLQKARLEALKRAVADAKLQATTVLTALNLKEKEVIIIHVDETSLPPVQLQRSEMSFLAKTAVVGGDAVVRGRVSLQIRY